MRCPSDVELHEFLSGGLAPERSRGIREHESTCPGCHERLARASEDESLLSSLRRAVSGEPVTNPERAAAPPELARYRIVRRVGAGAMGIVYEAEQREPRRRVALKVLHPAALGEARQQRFRMESEALARLEHPGIARVVEAGTFLAPAGPQPFFAMEFVDGLALDAYARERGLGARERVALVAAVCRAVQHAHQRGVVHRDLKPSNVLVDAEGRPRVLDFGIARSLDPDLHTLATREGELVGTLAYMSPEQASGDPAAIDTRTDVYSLGVVLFELLAGRLPVDVSGCTAQEAVGRIVRGEPMRLRSAAPHLAGDLDTITAKALAHAPDERYDSAAALADDLERFLADEPIAARAPSVAYALRKFVRRRPALASSLAALVLALVLGIAGTATQSVRARAAEGDATARAEEAESALDLFVELFGAGAGATPREWTVGRAARDAARRLERERPGLHPRVEATVRLVLGAALTRSGELDAARRQLELARDLRVELLGAEHPSVAGALNLLGLLEYQRGDHAAAEALHRRALELYRAAPGEHSGEIVTLQINLSRAVGASGRLDEAEELARAALDGARVLGDDHPHYASSLATLAWVRAARGADDEATTLGLRSLEAHKTSFGEDHPRVAAVLGSLRRQAEGLGKRGGHEQAKELLETCIEEARACGHPLEGALAADRLARLLVSEGRVEDALALQASTIDDLEGRAGSEAVLRELRANLGGLELRLGHLEEAERLFREALEGASEQEALTLRSNLAAVCVRRGDHAQAARLYEQVVAARRRSGGRAALALALNNLGRTHHAAGALGRAVEALDEAVVVALESLGEQHANTAVLRINLALALVDSGRLAAAAPALAAAARSADALLPAEHPKRAELSRAAARWAATRAARLR